MTTLDPGTAPEARSAEHEPSDITYDEQFYPARPKRLRPSARRIARSPREAEGEPVAGNAKYVEWLIGESMLNDAHELARQLSGSGTCCRTRSRTPIRGPRSGAPACGSPPIRCRSSHGPVSRFLSGLAETRLWEAFAAIGIEAIHTGPLKKAGGLDGWRQTPSVDGHFDRISMPIRSSAPRRSCERCP